MIGLSHRTLRLIVAGVLSVGLGLGVYYLWVAEDEEALEAARTARTTMRTAKQQAVEAGGPAAARTTFAKGLAAERRGDRLESEAEYQAAVEAFRGAAEHYRRSHTVADSLAVAARRGATPSADSVAVSPAQVAAARHRADSIRQRMLVMKKAADRAESDSLAPKIYQQALASSAEAQDAFEQDDYAGYTGAIEIFGQASQLFESAEEKAADRHAANIRRASVDELRQDVSGQDLPYRVDKLVQRAESLQTQAQDAYAREDFAYAANLLKESGVTFMRARSLHDSLRQAEQEAAAREKFRAEADQARQRMESARSDIPAIQKQQPMYEKARMSEREAQRMYEREQYAAAAEQFSTAARQYQAIHEMQIPLDAARDIVHEVVGRYQQALEEKNVYQLRDLLPGIDSHWWSTFFENATNVMASVNAGTLERTESGATVTIRVRLDYMDERNRMEHETFRSVWTLKPDDGGWMITSASMR